MGHAVIPAGPRENAAEKQVEALKLRQVGHTYRVIGEKLGISAKTAHNYVTDALKELAELSHHEAESLRVLEMSRLDEYMLILGPRILAGDMNAILTAIKINESRRKLMGIDMPTRGTSVQLNMTPAEIAALTDDELNDLINRATATGARTPG